jgi:cytochrome c-type biogenesis protein CcmH/NrfG
VLLDQKRTRRMVQITAILTSLAFAGVIFVVLGLVFFGGGGSTVADQQLSDAQALVKEQPTSADAWEQLASAQVGKEQFDEAIVAQRRALELDPDNLSRTRSMVAIQSQKGDAAGAITTLQAYTAKHPESAEAFLDLAQLAETSSKTTLARLSYQAFLRLAPNNPNADAIRAKLKTLT